MKAGYMCSIGKGILKISLCVLCTMLFLESEGCSKKKKEDVPVWRTDQKFLLEKLPFLKEIDTCCWKGGIAYDGSKGLVPSPSTYYMCGYIRINVRQRDDLLNEYHWTESSDRPDITDLPLHQNGEDQFEMLKFMHSEELLRSLSSLTTYRNGKILFDPDNSVLYFNLKQD